MKFLKKKDKTPSLYDQLIDDCMNEMLHLSSDSDAYSKMLDSLKDLHKLRDTEKSRIRVSPDAVAGIAGNLLGIGMIMSFEKANVITTKALGFVTKPKI